MSWSARPMAGRQRTELDNLIGLFINTLSTADRRWTDNPLFTNYSNRSSNGIERLRQSGSTVRKAC